jgi:hypothetical protein
MTKLMFLELSHMVHDGTVERPKRQTEATSARHHRLPTVWQEASEWWRRTERAKRNKHVDAERRL